MKCLKKTRTLAVAVCYHPLDLKDLDVVPTIKKEAVLDFCHKAIDEPIKTNYYPEPELCIYTSNNGEGVLAYKNITYIYNYARSYTMFIEAHTGKLLDKRRNWQELSENCYYCSGSVAEQTAEPCILTENCVCLSNTNIGSLDLPTLYYDCKTLDLTICEDDSWYQFYNTSNASKVIIINAADFPIDAPPVNFCHNEQESALLLNYNRTMAATAYWSGTKVYDFFLAHNINGYDNMGSPIKMGLYEIATNWEYGFNYLLLGDGSDGKTAPMVSLDIVAHEYTHGVLNNYYRIIDKSYINNATSSELESGGIHEGLADIMSVLVRQNTDNFNEPIEWKWQIGDLIQIGDGSADKDFPRKLHNPHDQENPQAMYYGSDVFEGEELWNENKKYDMAGVLAYWFYLLTEGGVGIKGLPVEGSIDLSISEAILFETLNQLKPADNTPDKAPSFVEFCDAAIAAATVLYGECSDNVVRVANAFAAVGLVKEDFTCDGYLGACVDMIEIDFALTPEDCLNDPNFDPNGGWQDNVPFGEWIVAQDASSGTGLTYEWTTDPDEFLASNPVQYDCEPISESCRKYRWYVTGLKSVTLTITDENGCTASHTEYINITSDLTVEECQDMNEFELVPTVSQPYIVCDSQTSICSNDNTGQITLIPNENYIGDINCYTFDLTQNNITIDDTPTYHNDGSISFECLTTGSYRIYAYNEIINCGWQYDATLNPISTPTENDIVPYQENSYYSISFGNGDLCEGLAEIVAINGENMATAYHYSFVWDDCNTAECDTYIRTDLCAGLYTITATNSLTGCSYIYEFEIDYRNRLQTFINIVLEGTFVANNTDGLMNTYARQANLLPTEQPYSRPPWDYYGTESVADTSEIPQTAVDWILVEVRHEADTTQIAGRAAGFLLRDGNIIGADGSPLRILNLLENEKYYVIVRHRNHLAISSRNSITLPNTEPTKYDFTASITQAKGNEQMRLLTSGKFAMCAGDANADGMIDTKDYQIYLDESSSINSYLPADFDINTHTTARDFNLMLGNNGAIGIDWIRYE